MSFVLADQSSWLVPGTQPFKFVPLQTFAQLREGVNDKTVDFFMWEHFTSKKYYDNGEIKRVGEIYTPWPSWQIVARTGIEKDERLEDLFKKIDEGVKHFLANPEESVEYISTQLDYSKEDATEWLKTVKFAEGTKGVDGQVVEKTFEILKKAGVVSGQGLSPQQMVTIKRS
jgi:ABC-type nitrate/sulfonate/bicarbonate transport system substrate-binding protein